MFKYKDAEKLKKDCKLALKQAGHRIKKRNIDSKRKPRKDQSLVVWQELQEKSAKELGYRNYGEWLEAKELHYEDE